MNTQHLPSDDSLPPELASLHADLDALACADAGAAINGLEDRVFLASRSCVAPLPSDIAPLGARVDRAAAADHAAGSPELEAQTFELSREAVTSGRYVEPKGSTPEILSPLRLSSADGSTVFIARGRGWATGLKAAAALLLAAGAVVLWVPHGARNPVIAEGGSSTDQLAENISTEMDSLYQVIGAGYQAASNDASGPGDGDGEHDTTWAEDLFSKESL